MNDFPFEMFNDILSRKANLKFIALLFQQFTGLLPDHDQMVKNQMKILWLLIEIKDW